MGPKNIPQTPKDKKKKLPAEFDPDEKVKELEREFYLFQLREIDKRLYRLGEREDRLRAETAEIEDQIEEVKKDKGAVVTLHEDLLTAKEEEKDRKREEMVQIKDEIRLRTEAYNQNIEDLEQQYTQMVKELTAKIEELEEEIRILEDYKQNREEYNKQLETLEFEMNESEKEHRRTLFRIERKWDNARGRVKKELQSRLLQLSIEFRQTSQKKIGNPCHRVTQENKAIHTALLEMKHEILMYGDKETKCQGRIIELIEHKNKKKEDKDKMIGRTIIQVHVIKHLLKTQAALWEKMKIYAAIDATNKMLLKKMHYVDCEIERKATAIERVNQEIDSKLEAMNMMKDAKRYLRKNTKRLHLAIRNALKVAEEAEAVRLIPLGELPDEKFLTIEEKVRLFNKRRESAFERRGRILQYLYELLSRSQLTEDDRKLLRRSSESVTAEPTALSSTLKSMHSLEILEEKESGLMADTDEKGPMFLTSLTSLPRSVSTLLIQPITVDSEEEAYGGGEEYAGEAAIQAIEQVVEEEEEPIDEEAEGEVMERRSSDDSDNVRRLTLDDFAAFNRSTSLS